MWDGVNRPGNSREIIAASIHPDVARPEVLDPKETQYAYFKSAPFCIRRRVHARILTTQAERTTLRSGDPPLKNFLLLLRSDNGQAVAEYAVVLAVILVLVVSTVRLVGVNTNNAFSQVGSALNQ